MRKISLNKKTLYIVLSTLIAIDIISTVVLLYADQIIHGDLYNYGLIFSEQWANKYWFNFDTSLILIWISLSITTFLLTKLYTQKPKNNKPILELTSILCLIISILAIISLFFMTQIDTIVKTELADFGVQYNVNWTRPYYVATRLVISLTIATIAQTAILSSYTLIILQKPKQVISKMISTVLLYLGILTVLLSILLNQTIGITTGIGAILTGLIISYISSQQYIKKKILTTQIISTYTYLKDNLKKIENLKILYQPTNPKNNNNIYIQAFSASKQEQLILKIKNSKELLAPGNQLTKLFEKTLNTDFIKTNIIFLIKKLPQLITENLEIATDFQIRNKKETIEIEFENSIYDDNEFTEEFSEIINQIGDPLTSATACAIAQATQKTLAITNYEINKQTKRTYVIYQLISKTAN